MHQVQVDVQQGGRAGLFVDHMGVPEFFDDSAWGHNYIVTGCDAVRLIG
jgi:hypothetical protein